MKNENRILILGDSTSMSWGLERETYPFLMAKTAAWPAGTTIVNASLPGMTTADACAFFFQKGKHLDGLRAVIIGLGDCDASATEIPKGRYTPVRQLQDSLRHRMGYPPKRSLLHNRMTPYEWNPDFNPTIEAPEKPEDYAYNLRRLLTAGQRMGLEMVLLRPQAHRYFPPGVGKGNFIFYRYLGLEERFASVIKIPDARFKEASSLHEDGQFEPALRQYRAILEEQGPLSASPEYLLLVANNYAVCAAQAGLDGEAQALFELLLKERGSRQEILLFNLAQLAQRRGNMPLHEDCLNRAYEEDLSLYRIREPYLKVIDHLGREFSNGVKKVSMAEIVADADYVDHCHPLPAAQKRLAQVLTQTLSTGGLRGNSSAVIENQLFNPELGLGNRTEFFTYFKTYASYDEKVIRGAITHPQSAPKEIRYALEYYLKHPFFTSAQDIQHYGPRTASDVGRFPEYFVIRHTIPYLRSLECSPDLLSAFNKEVRLLRSADDLLNILPPAAVDTVATTDPVIDPNYEVAHLQAVLRRLCGDLSAHLQRGPQIYERMKTTLYWYFRETLRFGAHSRVSMRYERLFLENAAETLAMCLIIDRALQGRRLKDIRAFIGTLESAVRIHERYCGEFSLASPPETQKSLLAQYAQELRALAADLARSATPALCIS